MAINVNRVILIGNLTRDADLKHTQSGLAVLEFSMALNSREPDGNDGWRDRVDFFDVVMFGERAEGVSGFMVKGKPVAVDGHLRQERWEKDGKKHSKVRVKADNIELVGSGGGNGSRSDYPDPDAAAAAQDAELTF